MTSFETTQPLPPDPPQLPVPQPPPPIDLPQLSIANPIQLVGASTADNLEPLNIGAPLIIEPPAGTADGDVMLAAVFHSAAASLEVVPPPGWTRIAPQGTVPFANPAVLGRLDLFYRIADGEPDSYVFDRGDPFFASCMHIVAYRYVDPDDPFVDIGPVVAPGEVPVDAFAFRTVQFRAGSVLVGTVASATHDGSGAGDGIGVRDLTKRVSTVTFDDKVLEGFDRTMTLLEGSSGDLAFRFPVDTHPLSHLLALNPTP